MDRNKLPDIAAMFEDLEQRDEILMKKNHQIMETLKIQNSHVDRLFFGYQALGILQKDTNESQKQNPIEIKDYLAQFNKMNKELAHVTDQEYYLNNKHELQKYLERHIINLFGLVLNRCDTIRQKMNKSKNDRMVLRKEALGLYTALKLIVDKKEASSIKRIKILFQKQNELLDKQDKLLKMEEVSMIEYQMNVKKRNDLIEQAEIIFSR